MKGTIPLFSLGLYIALSGNAIAWDWSDQAFKKNDCGTVKESRYVGKTFSIVCDNPHYDDLLKKGPKKNRWWLKQEDFESTMAELPKGELRFATDFNLVPENTAKSKQKYFEIYEGEKRKSRLLGYMSAAVYSAPSKNLRVWVGIKYNLEGQTVAIFGRDIRPNTHSVPYSFQSVQEVFSRYVKPVYEQEEYYLTFDVERTSISNAGGLSVPILESHEKKRVKRTWNEATREPFKVEPTLRDKLALYDALVHSHAYYCFNFIGYSEKIQAELDQNGWIQGSDLEAQFYSECSTIVKAFVTEIEAASVKNAWSNIYGSHYGEFQEVNIYSLSPIATNEFVRIMFDIVHEI